MFLKAIFIDYAIFLIQSIKLCQKRLYVKPVRSVQRH